jgi:hypothetical protein
VIFVGKQQFMQFEPMPNQQAPPALELRKRVMWSGNVVKFCPEETENYSS